MAEGACSGIDAFFIPGGSRRLFCVLHRPPRRLACAGAIVYLHPFAEEMNKSRRMAALQARALAAAGWLVLQPDLSGCGDSEGDFGDASWEAWSADACQAVAWLALESGLRPWLWGLRAGGLLAAAVSAQVPEGADLLLWQPVLSGKQHLQQFLRVKAAGDMLKEDAGPKSESPRVLLSRGESIEVAGYRIAPGLASGMDAASMQLPDSPATGLARKVVWLEVSSAAQASLSMAAGQVIEKWRAAGWRVLTQVVQGPAFWQTLEIEEAPALIEASLGLIGGPTA